MIDKLVQYVLEEIAMDGDEGTDMPRLTSFIREASIVALSSETSSSSSASSSKQQTVDDAFVSYIWSVLIAQEDVHVGLIEQVDPTPKSEPEPEAKPGKKMKGKSKANDAPPTHVMRILDNPASREELLEEHGSAVRIVVGANTAWLAITGSSTRPTSLTPPVYATLQLASRGRGDGATVVTIGKALGYDQKSAFHFVRVAVQLGVVKKFRTTDRGSWTNRVVHVRYLDRSKEWKIHNMNEPGDDEDEAKVAGDDDDDDEPAEVKGLARRMSAIGHHHISTNLTMVRKRIIRSLKKRDQHFMPHSQIAPAIGLNHYTKNDLRRLNKLISDMAREGVVEKLLVTDRSRRRETQVNCVRLVEFDADGDGDEHDTKRSFELEDEHEPEDDDTPHALALVPIDRQIIELIAESGPDGVTCSELSIALGGYNQRTIDQTLSRVMRKDLVPAQLKDYCVDVMTETFGREKRSRYFNHAGYAARCRQDGVDLPLAETELDEGVVGGWQPIEKCYASLGERKAWTAKIDLRNGGKPYGGDGGVVARAARNSLWQRTGTAKIVKQGRPRGSLSQYGDSTPRVKKEKKARKEKKEKPEKQGRKAKSSTLASTPRAEAGAGADTEDEDERAAGSSDEGSGDGGESRRTESPKPKGPRGRPRKRPREDGVMTYYEKLKFEEAERARLGMAPRQKGWTKEQIKKDRVELAKRQKADRIKRGLPAVAPKPKIEKNSGKRDKGQVKQEEQQDFVEDEQDEEDDDGEDEELAAMLGIGGSSGNAEPVVATEEKEDEAVVVQEPPKRGRGRPRRPFPPEPAPAPPAHEPQSELGREEGPAPVLIKRGRGRPRKSAPSPKDPEAIVVDDPEPEPEPKPGSQFELVAEKSVTPPVTPRRSTRSGAAATPAVPSPAPPSTHKRTRAEVDDDPAEDAATPVAAPVVTGVAVQPTPTSTLTSKQPAKKARVEFSIEVPICSFSPGKLQPIEHRVSRMKPCEETTDSSAPSPSRGDTPFAANRPAASGSGRPINLVVAKRREEILSYIEHVGGIAEATGKLNVLVKEHADAQTGGSSGGLMDRKHLVNVVNFLVDSGRLKRIVVQAGSTSSRAEVLYLPSVDVDCTEMRAFLAKISSRTNLVRGRGPRAATARASTDLVLHSLRSDRYDEEMVENLEETDPAEIPGAAENRETVRDFFRRSSATLGARFGVYYGRYARARHLHTWLVGYFASLDKDDPVWSKLVVATEPNIVFARELLETVIPLGDYLRTIPIPIESDELDKFVQNADNHETPLKDLPRSILALIETQSAKRRAALWMTLKALIELDLLVPLAPSSEASEDSTLADSLKIPARPKYATHWALVRVAPLYMYSSSKKPLVDVVELKDGDAAASYWSRLKKLTLPSYNSAPAVITDPQQAHGFPLTSPVTNLVARHLCSTTKWHDSYMLLTAQRQYLTRMQSHDLELINEPDRLAQLADDLLAPIEVVEAYWHHIESGRQGSGLRVGSKRRLRHRRRRRTRVSGTEQLIGRPRHGRRNGGKRPRLDPDEADSDSEGHWSAASDDEDSGDEARVDARTALKRKAVDAEAQRERDFEALLQRFKTTHSNVELEPDILFYIRGRFHAGGRHGIDLKQVEHEFRVLLPNDDPDHLDPAVHKSIVPSAVVRSVQMANDPYALPRTAAIRRKPKSATKKAAALGPVVSMRPFKGAAPAVVDGVDRYANNRQNEFLSMPARKVPEVMPGHRLPRNFISEEQVDLLLDCVAIIKARSDRLKRRMVFTPLSQIFPAPGPVKLRQAYVRRLATSPVDAAYFERLVASWEQIWTEQSGNLPDPHPTDLTNFNLVAFLRFFRQHVDKRALRLGAPVAAPVSHPHIKLPNTIEELKSSFHIESGAAMNSPVERWYEYWSRVTIGSLVREREAASLPFAIPCEPEKLDLNADPRLVLAQGALKMVLATPQSLYSEEVAKELLEPVGAELTAIVPVLVSQGVIARRFKESSRRGPGRNYMFSERFVAAFDELVSPARLLEAQTTEVEIAQEEASILPLDVSEGGMMALVRLVSYDLAELEIDTAVTEELRNPDDYQTRSKDDEAIECSVQIVPKPDRSFARPDDVDPGPPRLPREGYTDDADGLEKARDSLKKSAEDDAHAALQVVDALQVLDELITAGRYGLSVPMIQERVSSVKDSRQLHGLAERLTSTEPPLAFWAGLRVPTLVASQHLSSWCVRLPVASGVKTEDEVEEDREDRPTSYVFPAVWNDIRGKPVVNYWKRAMAWMQGALTAHAGATITILADKSDTVNLLSFPELMMLLETLEQRGFVERKWIEEAGGGKGFEEAGEERAVPGWDEARWYLTEKWY